jgi:hypothetical protein
MIAIPFSGQWLPTVLAHLIESGGDRFAALLDRAMTARYGRPPPLSDDSGMDDLETRLLVALICAAHP